MTSNDNALDMSIVTLILNQLSAMRQENSEFRREMKQEMQSFKTEIRQDIHTLQGQVAVIQDDITGLKHDVSGLYHWDYWLLSVIIAVIAMPQIGVGVKSLFDVVVDGVGRLVSVFRKGNQS